MGTLSGHWLRITADDPPLADRYRAKAEMDLPSYI